MNRAEFMRQLKALLDDISEAERQEALDYYESYFDDAGPENEAEVIRELGSPGKVAALIKADLKESNENYAEYTENGYEDSRTRAEKGGYQLRNRKKRNKIPMVLIIIMLIFISPFLSGTVTGVAAVIIGIACLPFLLVFGLGAGAVGLIAGAVITVVLGVTLFATSASAAIFTIGAGCLLMAVGILMGMLVIWLASRVVPALLRKFTDFCSNLLSRGKKAKGGADV